MERYFYKGEIIEYAGFKMEDKFCFRFVGDEGGKLGLAYLSKLTIDTLQKA